MHRQRRALLILVAAALTAASLPILAQQGDFDNWPKGSSPLDVGNRVAARFVVTPHTNFIRPGPPKFITYPETCTWYGALRFAQISGNKELTAQLIKRFDPLLTPAEAHLIPEPSHVDLSVFGAVPLELYIQTKEKKYLDIGQGIADKQWEKPNPDGFTNQTRWWIDDMFMITAVQVQAYRATGDAKYINRSAAIMAAYLDKLQQPNGLFYHAPDVPFF
ncbi:MAG: glycosyl hydrolase, partial [Acidobacteriales bacterium]